jgi:hypothetical protein
MAASDARIIAGLMERVRRLELHARSHAEIKTFIIPGEITSGVYVPPFWVGVDTDGDHPEFKTLYAFRGVMNIGSVTVQWLVNGVQVGDDHVITNLANEFEVIVDPALFPAAELSDGDVVQPSLVDATVGASDFSGAVYMLTRAA